jgi:hypothetical protein
MIAKSLTGSSIADYFYLLRCILDINHTEQKKCPPTEDGHNPRSGPRDAEFGAAHRWAARLSAITRIGCVYADEPSIGGECDPDMTRLK